MLEFTGERYMPHLRGQIYYEHVHRYALAKRLATGLVVADIACGEGYGSSMLSQSATQVIGIDVDETVIDHARRVYFAPNLKFLRGSVDALPLADQSVDMIASFETIEHVQNHVEMLREFRRCLKPKGTLLISSPNKHVYSDLANYSNEFHVSELYFGEFRDALRAQFKVVNIVGQRIVGASLVFPLSKLDPSSGGWLSGRDGEYVDGLQPLSSPMYFIAVCSDEELHSNLHSGFIDPSSDMLTEIWAEIDATRRRHDDILAEIRANAEPKSLTSDIVEQVQSDLSTQLDEATQTISRLANEALAQRSQFEEKIAGLTAQYESESASHHRALQELTHQNARLMSELESDRRALAEAQTLLGSMSQELQVGRDERALLKAILASRSWRLTAPVRHLTKLARPGKWGHNR